MGLRIISGGAGGGAAGVTSIAANGGVARSGVLGIIGVGGVQIVDNGDGTFTFRSNLTFAGLGDVQLAGLADGQVPVWNAAAAKWENKTLGAAPPWARMHLAGAQAAASGTIIHYDTIDDDPAGICTVGAAAKITASKAGPWLAIVRFMLQNSNADCSAAILLNGNPVAISPETVAGAGNWGGALVTDVLNCNVGDSIQGQMSFVNGGPQLNPGSTTTWITAIFQGAT